jgi:two-component system CheB/CheR fusion protein
MKTGSDKFPIVALGGSAGSLQALDDFFSEISSENGFAFVIIMHLVPKSGLNIASLIQKFTQMQVIEVVDGMQIRPNHVYVIPPMKNMAVQGNRLLLFSMSEKHNVSHCIDFFLKSLSEARWNKAVAIIFSGLGNDGQIGVRMIAEKLGLTMVQSPDSAQYPGMPESAIATDCVHFVLHPKEMPKELINYIKQPLIYHSVSQTAKEEERHHINLQKILLLLRSHTGHDFTLYKTNTINRRIERRMVEHKLAGLEAYLDFITLYPFEMNVLFKEMLIGVTRFFRDTEAFESITRLLYEKMDHKKNDSVTRIWIAGCSTGEEAYSIAIIILEYLEKVPPKRKHRVQIFATDLDDVAIEYARIGYYDARIVNEMSEERLKRFFIEKNNGYIVKKELREMIVFAKHSLINDAPFTKLDLLCCRNVMIYFSATLQKRLFPVFHYSLNNNGLLFLGPAETIGSFDEAFMVVNPKWKIFERRNGTSNLVKMIDFPFNIVVPNLKKIELPNKPITKIPMANSFHKILIDRYTPASLLVNEKGDILYINGNVNSYLSLETGEAVMNIHKVIKNELRHAIGNAIHQAWQQKKNIPPATVKVPIDGKYHMVTFAVDYLNDTHLKGMFIITFSNQGEVKSTKKAVGTNSTGDALAVKELESELSFTKLQLNSTIEQMESSLEELKSTNEELQSTNEELQSTNEEALTTKEEMQSLNEELMTINLQHQTKTDELTRLNNDMKNLLDNTEIGTIFLDNNLKILRFTPQVTKLFNVIPQDVGRSITHIVSNFDYPEIENAIIDVVERLTGRELEVKTKKEEWYNLRIMPYRTLDNFINGAVLTFTKITPLKSLEDKLENLLSYAQSTLEHYDDAAIMLSSDQKILIANHQFLKLFRLKIEEIREQSLMELVVNKWKAAQLAAFLTDTQQNNSFYMEHNFPGIGPKKITIELLRKDTGSLEGNIPFTVFFKDQTPYEKQEQNHNDL